MEPERRRLGNLGRRYTDRKWPRHARDFWMLAVTIIALFGVKSAVESAGHADRAATDARLAVRQVQREHDISARLRCAVVSAVSEAGKQVIAQPSALPPRLERFLERHGYPPAKVRSRAATKAGEAYVRAISVRIHQLVGHRGDGLIRANGTIDCHRLSHFGESGGA